jgi:hypothetical protein
MNFEPLFKKVEDAIDAHPKLSRVTLGEPSFNVDRGGWSVKIRVALKGSRKKPTEVHGEGETPEEAVEKLVNGLDIWAKAIA